MRPGPAPRPADTRRRRNPPTTGHIPVPRDGYTGPVPDWPATLTEPTDREHARWVELWRTPQAAAWADTSQEYTLVTLIRLEQACDRGRIPGQLVAELRHLRGELGLTLEAMAKLGMELTDDEPEQPRAPARGTRRLHAVDPTIA